MTKLDVRMSSSSTGTYITCTSFLDVDTILSTSLIPMSTAPVASLKMGGLTDLTGRIALVTGGGTGM